VTVEVREAVVVDVESTAPTPPCVLIIKIMPKQ
jgi:hypothetical protein